MSETSKYPTEIIELPSKGYFYPESSPLSKGEIELKYMTAKEEDILMSPNLIKKGVVLDKLLQSLIVTPINYDELLIGDKNAILVAARILAYGKDYTVKIDCPSCGTSNTKTIDLSTLDTREVDTSKFTKGSPLVDFELPISKKTVTIKLLTHADEEFIDREAKGYKKINPDVDSEITTRLKRIIVAVDKNGDRMVINNFVTGLLSRDSLALRQFFRDCMPDIKLAFDFSCDNCSHTEEIPIPLNSEFFWPAGRR